MTRPPRLPPNKGQTKITELMNRAMSLSRTITVLEMERAHLLAEVALMKYADGREP
jgi:chorismate mutase